MSAQELANPFSTATVVVAEDYVNTFPHPQGLITYLHRLCLQLGIDIVSLERPVTVKGSWKTIIKIDAFLKTLISTLHNAVSKGAVPNEKDFTTAFALFEEENNYKADSLEGKHTAKTEIITNDLSQIKADDILEVLKFDEDDTDASLLNKWYCNSNPRNRTVVVDKYRGMCPNSEKVPPAPYVIVDADDTNKICHTSLSEIEHALTQVYKKETIEKYKQKTVNCVRLPENTAVLDHFNCSKKTVNPDSDGLSQAQLNDAQKIIISESNVKESAENCATYSLKYEEIMMDNELKISEPKSYSYSEKGVAKVSSKIIQDSLSRPLKPGKKVRHKNSKRKTTPECIENSFIMSKRKRERRSSRIKRRKEICKATIEEICKASKCDDTLQRLDPKTLRHSNKTSPHQNNQEVSKSVSKLEKKDINEKFQSNISAAKSKIITDTILTPCRQTEIKNKEMRNHHKNKDLCSRTHNKKDLETRNHHKKEELQTQYYCDQCSYLTSKQLQLLEHKRRVHMTKKFQCDQCLKEFGFRKDLRRHEKCHDKANNCCDICGKMYKDIRKLMEHKRIHDNDYIKPEFPCKFCTKKFSTKYVLAYHIKSDHLGMKRSYICPTCGKSFSQKNSYFQHANVHLGIKPFSCEVCGKRFSYEKSVKEHMFMHNEEKIFLCTFCPKSFRQASGLSIHLRVHKATKDYVCSMCGKGFSQKQSLVRHERIHGGEKPYECGICQRTFADSSVLRRHMILIHKKDVKQWRQDTLCHITKRADFYISVLNGDSLHSNNFETEKANEKTQENCQQNICYQQETDEQMELEQDCHLQTARSVPQIPGTYDNVMKNSAFTNTEAPGIYTNASSADVKPYAGYSSEKPDNAINAITTVTNDVESSLFSTSSLHIHSTASLQVNNSLTVSPSHHYQTSLVTHPVQPQTNSSFIPITYHQRSVNYGTSNIQSVDMPHAQYSAVMAQPYAQTIVLVQDSLGTTTYHQPGVNVAYSEDSAVLNVHLQQISPSMPMSSSPMPHLTDIPQTMASKTSSNTFDQVISPSYQQPH